ncbi:unnamed protein product [Commensalibacter communis]|nr:unnamed protein product [Commensalibacter communis]CAI3944708.1 unnamed protein product [Commensalibacter communis]
MNDILVVGCKLPFGVHLDLDGKRVTLNGAMKSENGEVGLTQLPKDFWESWLAKHQDFAPVTTGHIFAAKSQKKAIAEGKEKGDLKTGLEPVDPKTLPKGTEQIEAGQTT